MRGAGLRLGGVVFWIAEVGDGSGELLVEGLATIRSPSTYFIYSGTGPDLPPRWQPHSVTMQRDTVVIIPDEDQCYVVWRGVWPFAAHPDTAYRRLEVTLDENM